MTETNFPVQSAGVGRSLARTLLIFISLLAVLLAAVVPFPAAAMPQPTAGTTQVPPSLVALFNTAGNLGFATIRAAFSPADQPPPQAAADWLLVDFQNARQWSAASITCIPFDLTRFENAASLVRSARPAARDVWQVADRLHRDYRVAVTGTSCTFGLPSKDQILALYDGALFMGFATGRASYFYYDTPIPRQVVDQIAGDFPVVRAGLAAVQGCIGSTASIEAQMDAALRRLGAVPGKDSYTEIAGIYIAIETALKNAACANAPAPTPAADPAACMQTMCAEVCRGSVVLLGVVSGSPECQACLEKNCRNPL